MGKQNDAGSGATREALAHGVCGLDAPHFGRFCYSSKNSNAVRVVHGQTAKRTARAPRRVNARGPGQPGLEVNDVTRTGFARVPQRRRARPRRGPRYPSPVRPDAEACADSLGPRDRRRGAVGEGSELAAPAPRERAAKPPRKRPRRVSRWVPRRRARRDPLRGVERLARSAFRSASSLALVCVWSRSNASRTSGGAAARIAEKVVVTSPRFPSFGRSRTGRTGGASVRSTCRLARGGPCAARSYRTRGQSTGTRARMESACYPRCATPP
jgi:hypothetical protein